MSELDAALEALAGRGAEWGDGLSNHAPMCAEALHALGHDDVIAGWVARYVPVLDRERERERTRIEAARWRDALGDNARIGDWNALFVRELSEAEATDVLRRWVPRLVPGLVAAATHGAIRVAHAVRALDEHPTEPRLAELAAALGYWAATYERLPHDPRPTGTASPRAALAAVPLVASADRGSFLISHQLRAVGEVEGFGVAVDAIDPADTVTPDALLDAVIDAAAGAYLAGAPLAEIAFVHGITGPAALRLLLPYLADDNARRDAVMQAWLVVAAITAAYGDGSSAIVPDDVAVDWTDLAAAAVADGGEHRIKLIEACRREHRRRGSSAVAAVAKHRSSVG